MMTAITNESDLIWEDVAMTTAMRYAFVGIAALCAGLAALPATAQQATPVKLGIVTFLSGAAAGPFGVPARSG